MSTNVPITPKPAVTPRRKMIPKSNAEELALIAEEIGAEVMGLRK